VRVVVVLGVLRVKRKKSRKEILLFSTSSGSKAHLFAPFSSRKTRERDLGEREVKKTDFDSWLRFDGGNRWGEKWGDRKNKEKVRSFHPYTC
jgi:hypothetical protein